MKILLTADRVRSILTGARTEKDVEHILRAHRVRFSWTTSPGFLAARVPVRSGSVLIIRTASRSTPFSIRFDSVSGSVSPVSVFQVPTFPVPRFPVND